ncbi:MAG: hypothetical protein RIE73_09360 [Coleofasciculus sp. C1-SOL-03]|uniref:hypothetical protein n=1 Tax=Coleofasciculus sp. C1-SOL-03 TaxID=3069522 RepID=UPI0032F845D0
MSQSPAPISTSQANPTTPPIDPTPLLQYGDNPTAIILSIAILLWVLRPVMLRQQSNPGETSRSTQGKYTALGKRAIASFVRVFNSEN